MIKLANNLRTFILKQAADPAKFVNYSKDPSFVDHSTYGGPAVAPKGEYPQSYAFEEDAEEAKSRFFDVNDTTTTPREWAMLGNTEFGTTMQANQGRSYGHDPKTYGQQNMGRPTTPAAPTTPPIPAYGQQNMGRPTTPAAPTTPPITAYGQQNMGRPTTPAAPTRPITAYGQQNKASAVQAGTKSKPYINPNSAEGRLAAQTNGPGRPLADQRDQFGAMNMETAMADSRKNTAKLEAEMRAADTLTNPQTPDYRYDAVESMRARRPGRV